MTAPEAPPSARRKDRLLNTVLAGKYKISKKIGEGGMGSVYIATQEPIDRKVAIKVLLGKLAEDEIAVKRFEQEARAISKMQHPNTVTIYDFGRTEDDRGDERLYIVMEYLKGRTLTQVLRAEHQLAGPRASRIIRQVCASLSDAHGAGIIHRDLKPDNIFLTSVGGDRDWVKVLDFGVAKLADNEVAGTLTQTGMIFGTPKYMSPEQAEGRPIDYRADIYALGIVMYELVTGRPPFVADTPVALLLKHISEEAPPFHQLRPDLEVEPRLEAIVRKAIAKDPEARYQQVLDLAADLEAYERTATGGYVVPTGTVPTPMAGGLPTEVMSGGATAEGTPSGIQSPHAVPDGISDGVPAASRTEPAGSEPVLEARTDHAVPLHRTEPGVPADSGSIPPPAAGPRRSAWWMPVAVTASVAAAAVLGAWWWVTPPAGPSVDSVQRLPPPAGEGEPAEGPSTEDTEVAQGNDAPKTVPPEPDGPAPAPEEPPRRTERRPARKSPEARPTRRPARPARPERLPLRVASQPSKARVFMNGRLVGVTPVELPPMEVGQTVRLTFRRPGFRPVTRRVTIGQQARIEATMEKRGPAPRPKSDEELLKEAKELERSGRDNLKVGDLK